MSLFRSLSISFLKRYLSLANSPYCQSAFSYSKIFSALLISCKRFNEIRHLTTTTNLKEEEKSELMYEITFVKRNGEKIKAKGKEGDTLLDVVINNNLDFDGYGACEGTLTCSTCHVILKKEDYDRLPDKPNDEEMDMLDLAYELTDTSRLGCQITLTKDLDGLEVQLPSSINDARS